MRTRWVWNCLLFRRTFDRRSGRRLHWFVSRAWSWLIMKTIFSPVKVMGSTRLTSRSPHVYAVTHASARDIPFLYVYLPFQFRIFSKKELCLYPVVGWQLKSSVHVASITKPTNSIAAIRFGVEDLKAGMAAGNFSLRAGRTYTDGEIKPFFVPEPYSRDQSAR